jgi:two-component system sensor histidine kinase/response regulator
MLNCSSTVFTAVPDKILVVDDMFDNSFLLQVVLEQEGYQVEIASSGIEALSKIETQPPSLVLLDVMMPDMDGYEVTQRIRQNNHIPFIPILLITGYDQPTAAQGFEVGADDFIRKPVDFDLLLGRIRSILPEESTNTVES